MTSLIPIYLFFIPIIFSWSLPNFLFKHVTQYFTNGSLIILYHLVYHAFLLPIIIYNVFADTKEYRLFIENYKNSPKNLIYIVFAAVSLGLLSQYCYFILLRRYDVTTILPIIRGFSAIVILLVGYYAFKENVNLKKIIGVILTVIGIYLITQSSSLQ